MDVKITINSEERIIMIPMTYDKESDTLSMEEVQIEPTPKDKEDLSKDVVVNLAHAIIGMLRQL